VPTALFDLDGTLTDPKQGITRSLQHGLAHVGITVTDPDSLAIHIGPPLRETFSVFAGLAPAEVEVAVLAYREYFADRGMFENQVYDGIPECLEELRRSGWRLAVATSKPTVFADGILEHFSLREAFDVVVGSELDGSRDDKHSIITLALEILGIAPSTECVMAGDRKLDVAGAHSVGIGCAGVAWGYGGIDELTGAGADRIVHRPSDLAPTLQAMVLPSPGR
jgi:phosphoglycolate phosphatase